MPLITYSESTTATESLDCTAEQWLEIRAKYGTTPAQRIREQLEAERMTVKQILENNAPPWTRVIGQHPYNILTPIEAIRRRVERAAELVRERKPGVLDSMNPHVRAYQWDDEKEPGYSRDAAKTIGAVYMQSTAQWHLLREVIGDEELKELIQK